MAAATHVYFINVLRNGTWHSSGFSQRSTSAAKVRAAYLRQHPSVRSTNIKAVRHSMSKRKVGNPTSACAPIRRGAKGAFNSHDGQEVMYRGVKYRIIGCGVGKTARRSIGKQEEGTYSLLNEKTNRVIYVAKRVVRDLIYRKGRLGGAAPKGPRTAKARARKRAKMTPAERAAWKRKMDRAKAAKASRRRR